MTDKTISALIATSTLSSTDVFPVTTTVNGILTTEKISVGDLRNVLNKSFVTVATDGTGNFNCDGTDDDVQINAAINSISGGTVLINKGIYNITSPVIVYNNIHLIGTGPGSTVLNGNTSVSAVVQVGDHVTLNSNTSLEDLEITRTGTPALGTFGLLVLNTSDDARINCYRNLYIHNNDIEVQLGRFSTNDWDRGFGTFDSCIIGAYKQVNTRYGVIIDYAIEKKFHKCRIQGFNTEGVRISNGSGSNDLHFTDCYIGSVIYAFRPSKQGADYAMHIQDGGAVTCTGTRFDEGGYADLFIEKLYNSNFANCSFQGANAAGSGVLIRPTLGYCYQTIFDTCIFGYLGLDTQYSYSAGAGCFVIDDNPAYGGYNVRNISVNNCQFTEGNWLYGIQVVGSYQDTFSNNHFTEAGTNRSGVQFIAVSNNGINSSFMTITGNTVDAPNLASCRGIWLPSGTTKTAVTGNNINVKTGGTPIDDGSGGGATLTGNVTNTA